MNTFRSEVCYPIKRSKGSLGSSFSDESGSTNILSSPLSCPSSYSSSLTPSRQLLLESTSENMDVIKEFRNMFLEKYLEKNKIGRKSKLTSRHRTQRSSKSCIDKNIDAGNKDPEYQILSGKENFEKFQIEFFNSDLGDVKNQSYSLTLNSNDEDSFESLKKISNSYSGNYELGYAPYYSSYYETPQNSKEFFPNSLPLNNIVYEPATRFCLNNGFENEQSFRSFSKSESLKPLIVKDSENYKLNEDDNKIFSLEIESKIAIVILMIINFSFILDPHNTDCFFNNDNFTEFSSVF